jgi:hypothetical protein
MGFRSILVGLRPLETRGLIPVGSSLWDWCLISLQAAYAGIAYHSRQRAVERGKPEVPPRAFGPALVRYLLSVVVGVSRPSSVVRVGAVRFVQRLQHLG